MIKAVAVLLGGATGSLIRYGLAVTFPWKTNSYFPMGTLSANLIGCFLIGLLWGLADSNTGNPKSGCWFLPGCWGASLHFLHSRQRAPKCFATINGRQCWPTSL